jgi:hypothetical protein
VFLAGRGGAPTDWPLHGHPRPQIMLSEGDRWRLLARCLHDTSLPNDLRVAGALLLLYGLPVSRIIELTPDRLDPPPTRQSPVVCGSRQPHPLWSCHRCSAGFGTHLGDVGAGEVGAMVAVQDRRQATHRPGPDPSCVRSPAATPTPSAASTGRRGTRCTKGSAREWSSRITVNHGRVGRPV